MSDISRTPDSDICMVRGMGVADNVSTSMAVSYTHLEQKNYGAVSGCTNSGAVSTSNASAYGIGGIVGWARYDGAAPAYAASAPITVTGCANSASVQGGSCAGGIVGTFYNAGTVSGNTNTAASITSSSFAGEMCIRDRCSCPRGYRCPHGSSRWYRAPSG